MKLFNLLTLSAICSFSLAAFTEIGPQTRDITVAINDVFIPGGFDTRADAYVVVSGLFPNSCYKWKQADIKHITAVEHEITATATVHQGMCLMMLIPFSKDVRLGMLSKGEHLLRFLSGDGTFLERQLVIE